MTTVDRARKPSIAIIDDDDFVTDSIVMLLEHSDRPVESFKTCESFLDGLDVESPPACLLLDLHFPGMDGVELQRKLAGLGANIPTIVLTARPDGPLVGPALDAGALAILTKPVDSRVLLQKIQSVLHRQPR